MKTLLMFMSLVGPMGGVISFPHTALLVVSDNFNRANSGTLGANWSNSFGAATPIAIVSSPVKGAGPTSTSSNKESWTANVFTNNQFSKAQFIGVSTQTVQFVTVRTATATGNGYGCGRDTVLDATHYVLWKDVAGTASQVGSTSATAVNSNDIVELDAVGTTLTCKANGSTVVTATDASLSTGSPGLFLDQTGGGGTTIFTNWSGGNL